MLGFCLKVVSKCANHWPPTEEVLAGEFVNWLGFSALLTRDALTELCRAKGVNLSFVSLPQDIRGFNCSFREKNEIAIAERETAPFSDSHTLFHEFREMLEHIFVEIGHSTIETKDVLEARAEQFAVLCRIKTAEQELPAFFEMATNVGNRWARYFAYAALGTFAIAYLIGCVLTPQVEELYSKSHG